MLRAAAVVGREFPAVVLATILQRPEDADGAEVGESLLELVGEALDAGALVERSRTHYAFAHALTRQTLYEELRVPQRIALHRRAGEALESCLGTARESHLAELAHHAFEAAPGGDVARAVGLAVEAAEFAHRQHAYEEAVEQYARALEALELAVPPDPHRRCLWLIPLLTAAIGFRQADMRTLPNSIKADVIDWDEARTGERKEGTYCAAWNLVDKLAGAVSVLIVGFLIQGAEGGLDVEGVRTVVSALPAGLLALSTMILAGFRLDESEHARVRDQIASGRAVAQAAAS